MKLIRFIFISILIHLSVLVYSSGVDKSTARKIAENLFDSKKISNKDFKVLVKENCFLVENNHGGWVLVSKSYNNYPVIGYSITGKFNENLTIRNFLNSLTKSTLKVEKNYKRDWDYFTKKFSTSLKSSFAKTIDPIIKVEWDQGAGWNKFCPVADGGPDGKVYVGCVAVASAQAMSVYKYPNKGYGKHSHGSLKVNFSEQTYDWNNMSSTNPDDENAKLMYHLAVGLNMNFSPEGSGSYTHDVPKLLKDHFLYDVDCKFLSRSSYEDKQWDSIMKAELNNDRPLIYSGNDGEKAGHCFNIDGYDEIGMFHVNWGWSGSGNGYFSVNNLSYNGSFNNNQGMVIGVKPLDHTPRNITLSKYEIEEKNKIKTFVAKIIVEDYTPDDSHTLSITNSDEVPFLISNDSIFTNAELNFETKNEYTISIKAIDSKDLFVEKDVKISVLKYDNPPEVVNKLGNINLTDKESMYQFNIFDNFNDFDNENSNITLEVIKNSNVDVADVFIYNNVLNVRVNQLGKDTVVVKATSNNKFVTDTAFIDIVKFTDISTLNSSEIKLYPNPAIHSIKLSDIETPTYYFIYNMNGVEIDKGKTTGDIDVENLPEGQYLLRIKLEKDITRTFIKK